MAVLLGTTVLFLSGCAIQQRTLRDLRAAIRPREANSALKINLPDRFRTSTREYEDGTIVAVDESEIDHGRTVIEETETVEGQRNHELSPAIEDEIPIHDDHGPTRAQLALLERITAEAAAKSWAVENPDPLSKSRVPVTRAQRRRMIKEEIRRLAQSQEPVRYQRRLW